VYVSDRLKFIDGEDGMKQSGIEVSDVTFDDRAEYMCFASNRHGGDNDTITLRVRGAFPQRTSIILLL